jgi:hypothetical protein
MAYDRRPLAIGFHIVKGQSHKGIVMNRRIVSGVMAGIAMTMLGGSSLIAGEDGHRGKHATVRARLVGFQEVPAISTVASGAFRAEIDLDAGTITWALRYDGLEGNVTQAHVHFGQHSVNGGISYFLCSNLANPPPGTQACPPSPGEITGVITAADVIGPGPVTGPPAAPGQGIEPGALAEIAAAMRAGVAYANVHTSKWPGGEIRGQLR